jgi:predicted ArsR family transcriptional regulator
MTAKRAAKKNRSESREAPFAYAGLERIFHERGRLAVCTCLVAHPDGLTFTELQDACGLTDGNLSRHLSALAEMGIVAISKESGAGRPTTTCRITKSGRTRFLSYIDQLELVVRDVHAGAEAIAEPDGRRRATRFATT